jgi:hypothetical protein
MNTNTATEYRNLPLTESVDDRNRDEVLAPYAAVHRLGQHWQRGNLCPIISIPTLRKRIQA